MSLGDQPPQVSLEIDRSIGENHMAHLIEKWDKFELAQKAHAPGNPFDVEYQAEFTHAGRSIGVAGFYDGDGVFKVRFMPELEGEWTYVTRSNIHALNGQRGSFTCTPPSRHNHGPVRVKDQFHFAYADGSGYLPVGTTCYVWNLQGDELEEQTLETLERAPFNKMRMCVFPKRYLFNQNEPPSYPFLPALTEPGRPGEATARWDLRSFNPQYFQRLEKRILDLQRRGIEADLIVFHPYDNGAWEFDRLPPEVNDRYLKYLVARLAAFRNLWWSFANEYDVFVGRSMQDWDHYFQLVQQIDPYDHLRSIHNCMSFYDHTRPWVTHCSIQSSNLQRVPLWRRKYGKPVVVDECCYEGDIQTLWGDLSPEEMALRFWVGFTLGGYVGHGETYANPEEELWWSKGGRLRGESPSRIAFLREIFEQVPGPGLTPIEKIDNETINMLDGQPASSLFGPQSGDVDRIISEGRWNVETGGYCGSEYFLFYFGMHQPRQRNFSLPEGSFRVDVIDTWNMTIETVSESASGSLKVSMPGRKYMAVRIQRNH
jgi:hypothetical protein